MRNTSLAVALACASGCLPAVASTSPEAYVYVSTTEGTYAYDASSTGKLTLIKGSPFYVPGFTIGTNGKYWTTYTPGATSSTLNSFEILPDGAIGEPISTIESGIYGGSQCGTVGGSFDGNPARSGQGEFDHTGENLYVYLSGAPNDEDGMCQAIQTYSLSSKGEFSFSGDTEFDGGDTIMFPGYLPTVTGNGKFGYGFQYDLYDESSCSPSLNLFQVKSQRVLQYEPVDQAVLPPPPPGFYAWQLVSAITDDPTDHIVLAMLGTATYDCGDGDPQNPYGPVQLASFIPNSQGTLTTTNTYKNMPVVAGLNQPTSMVLNFAGKILAVAVDTGVQFFHFNGSNPITKFTGIVGTSGSITHMAWDSENHLYALNSSGKMHVYTVTSSSVKELSGSRTTVPIGSFIVRSR